MPLLGLRVRQVDPGDVPDGRVGVLPGQDGVLLHGHGQLLARGATSRSRGRPPVVMVVSGERLTPSLAWAGATRTVPVRVRVDRVAIADSAGPRRIDPP